MALADALLAVGARSAPGMMAGRETNPEDARIRLAEAEGVTDRASGPPGLCSDHAFRIMTQPGLPHADRFGYPDVVPSCPALCGYLPAHAGG